MINNSVEKTYLVKGAAVYNRGFQNPDVNSLFIREGKIAKIGRFEELRHENPDISLLDYSDCYLLPGLINTHVHLEFDSTPEARVNYLREDPRVRLLRAAKRAETLLRSGVTTARDAGSSWDLLALHDPAAQEAVELPRLHLSGPPITITAGHLNFLGEEADSLDEVIKAVRLRKKAGCDAVKIVVSGGQMTPGSLPERTSYSVEYIRAMTDEARLQQLPTFSHCLTSQGFVNSMRGGIDSIDHAACFVRNQTNGLLERVYEPEIMEEFRGSGRYFMNGISAGYHAFTHCRERPELQTARESFLLEQERRECDIFRKYIELGLVPVVGTDAGVSFTYFDETWLELEVFVKWCGLTPAEAIDAATVNAAACIGLAGVTGKLAEGYSADVIALGGNPLKNIEAFRRVEHVICAGRPIQGEKTYE